MRSLLILIIGFFSSAVFGQNSTKWHISMELGRAYLPYSSERWLTHHDAKLPNFYTVMAPRTNIYNRQLVSNIKNCFNMQLGINKPLKSTRARLNYTLNVHRRNLLVVSNRRYYDPHNDSLYGSGPSGHSVSNFYFLHIGGGSSIEFKPIKKIYASLGLNALGMVSQHLENEYNDLLDSAGLISRQTGKYYTNKFDLQVNSSLGYAGKKLRIGVYCSYGLIKFITSPRWTEHRVFELGLRTQYNFYDSKNHRNKR